MKEGMRRKVQNAMMEVGLTLRRKNGLGPRVGKPTLASHWVSLPRPLPLPSAYLLSSSAIRR